MVKLQILLWQRPVYCRALFWDLYYFYCNVYLRLNYGVNSQVRLCADNCVVYTGITNEESSTRLQGDLNRIEQWCKERYMKLNLKKMCAY